MQFSQLLILKSRNKKTAEGILMKQKLIKNLDFFLKIISQIIYFLKLNLHQNYFENSNAIFAIDNFK